ncbi:MAG: hypothetical protein IKJ91_09325 [Clostridia bacterium]|nr:hypothetical protein [Clostridia bacterium]
MKIFSFFLVCLLTIFLLSCEYSSPADDVVDTVSQIDTIFETNETAESGKAVKNNDSSEFFELIDDYLYYQETSLSLLTSLTDNYNLMWNTIYKYPESQDVTETFSFLYKSYNISSTIEQLNERLESLYEQIIISDCSEDFMENMIKCHSSYMIFCRFVTEPNGSYTEFCDTYQELNTERLTYTDIIAEYLNSTNYQRKSR